VIRRSRESTNPTGATAVFTPLIAGVVEQSKLLFLQQDPGLAKDLNEIATKMRNDLAPRFSELSNEVATLYASNFTDDELKAILAFYQSPVGKKMLQRQPQVIDNSMKFAQTWATNLSDEVTAKILKFDQEKNRVSLGMKQLGEDPWVGLSRRYPQG